MSLYPWGDDNEIPPGWWLEGRPKPGMPSRCTDPDCGYEPGHPNCSQPGRGHSPEDEIEERVVYVVHDANGDDWTFDTREAAVAFLRSLPEEE
jgi:hypothetical protein